MAHGRQQDELQDITLLGNQDNTYNFDYRPDVLESFDNKHQGRDYFVNSTVQNLHHYVQLLGNQILQLSIFHIFQMLKWLNQNL